MERRVGSQSHDLRQIAAQGVVHGEGAFGAPEADVDVQSAGEEMPSRPRLREGDSLVSRRRRDRPERSTAGVRARGEDVDVGTQPDRERGPHRPEFTRGVGNGHADWAHDLDLGGTELGHDPRIACEQLECNVDRRREFAGRRADEEELLLHSNRERRDGVERRPQIALIEVKGRDGTHSEVVLSCSRSRPCRDPWMTSVVALEPAALHRPERSNSPLPTNVEQ